MSVISEDLKLLLAKAVEINREKELVEMEVKRLQEKIKDCNSQINDIAIQVHRETTEDGDMDTESFEVVVTGVGRVILAIDPCFNIEAADRPELINRLKNSEDTAGMVKEDVNPQTLKKYFRDSFAESGCYPHTDLVEVYNRPTLKFKGA